MFDVLSWIQDAPLKLVSGAGDPENGGCWMAAISVYSGVSWGDHPPCVDPMIRELCIVSNDAISTNEMRGRIIGPHILEPVGTATDDKAIIESRLWILVDSAVRVWAADALDFAGLHKQAESLRSLERIDNDSAASDAASAAHYAARYAARFAACDAANAASYAASCTDSAASDAASAARYAARYAANAARFAACDAARYAANAASAGSAASDKFIEEKVIPAIVAMCKAGDRAPVEPACDELAIRKATQCTI